MSQESTRRQMQFFGVKSAAAIESLAETILPEDDTPGARKAGVIYFIDRALMTFSRDSQNLYRTGLKDTNTLRRRLFPTSSAIETLRPEERIQLVQAIEKTEFFKTLREHTVMGFLADPDWGGNKEKAGWKLMGFDDPPAFDHPFGYYDDPRNGYLK